MDINRDGDGILDGCYVFGANELHIMKGLNRVLDYLELAHDLKV